jgi:hypothetical protein
VSMFIPGSPLEDIIGVPKPQINPYRGFNLIGSHQVPRRLIITV